MSGSPRPPSRLIIRNASPGFVSTSIRVSTNALKKPRSCRCSQGRPLCGAAAASAGTKVPAEAAAAPHSGLPWEHRQDRGFFNAFVETLMLVLTKPGEAFLMMRREGGLGEPLIYALIGG